MTCNYYCYCCSFCNTLFNFFASFISIWHFSIISDNRGGKKNKKKKKKNWIEIKNKNKQPKTTKRRNLGSKTVRGYAEISLG